MSQPNEILPSGAEEQRKKVAEEIARLKAEHEALVQHLEASRQWILQHYLPAWAECATAEANLAKELELAAINLGLSKADYEKVGVAIQRLLKQANAHFQSSKENEALMQRWQTEKNAASDAQEELPDEDFEPTAIEIEGMEELEQLDSMAYSNLSAAARKLYLSLAKRLHPDAEPDQERKLEKEELMKKVIAAFQQQDFETLLRMDAAYRETGSISPDFGALEEPLLNLLQRQYAQSKRKLEDITKRIAQSGLPAYNPNKPERGMRELKKQVREIKAYSYQLQRFAQHAKSITNRREIMDFIENLWG